MDAAVSEASASSFALLFVAWSRIWSPLVDDRLRREAWQQLELPGDFDALAPDFMKAFHVALPYPPVPLLLHAALNIDGGTAREDFVRIMDYLDIEYEDAGRLPPDHIACVCELLALSLDAGEPVLVDGIRGRYLLPWCNVARATLEGHDALSALVEQFAADLSSI